MSAFIFKPFCAYLNKIRPVVPLKVHMSKAKGIDRRVGDSQP